MKKMMLNENSLSRNNFNYNLKKLVMNKIYEKNKRSKF